MYLWTLGVCLLLAVVLAGIRLYLAQTSKRLEVHLREIDSLQLDVDDALQIVREEKPLISKERLVAGFALSEARWECMEALRWIEYARGTEDSTRHGPPPTRFKGDLYAWLILLESKRHYLLALKYARPLALDIKAIKKLSKLAESENFHVTQADEFIERLRRKQRN